jgi:hypothetical protein
MTFRSAFYKGTHPGLPGLFNRAVRAFDNGQYSHQEIVFSDGMSASSSFLDGGVRFKKIDFDSANWDFVNLPLAWETDARHFFEINNGKAYDIMGDIWQVLGFVHLSTDKLMCSAACMEALGYTDSWRFRPNAAMSVLKKVVTN